MRSELNYATSWKIDWTKLGSENGFRTGKNTIKTFQRQRYFKIIFRDTILLQ